MVPAVQKIFRMRTNCVGGRDLRVYSLFDVLLNLLRNIQNTWLIPVLFFSL